MHGSKMATENGSEAAENVSVFVMTYNEEVNIQRCLESVRWSTDVVVLDSFSEDQTANLAQAYPNVRVLLRTFDGYSNQRNYGLHQIEYRNPWLLIIDADEVVEQDLAAEILCVARQRPPAPLDVFLLRRKVFLEGRSLKRNVTSDFWIERLVRPKAVYFVGAVHEKLHFNGGFGLLTGSLQHHQFSKGVEDWFARRARYASVEAQEGIAASSELPIFRALRGNTLQRRGALKTLFHRTPGRWAIYLAYNLFFKLAFLDGILGLRYVLLESYSQYLSTRVKKEKAKDARAR